MASAPDASLPPPSKKWKPLSFDGSVDIGTAIDAIYWSCWSHWRANEDAARDGRNPEGVHQLRVGLRRARSATTLFKSELAMEWVTWFSAEAKWSLSFLGPARDWDVFLSELLPPVRSANPNGSDFGVLEDLAEQKRVDAYGSVREGLGSDRYSRFCCDFESWLSAMAVHDGIGAQPLRQMATMLLNKRHEQVMRRGTNFETLPPAERHRVRMALKKLRYAVEFFESLYPANRITQYKQVLKCMQDDLGHLNDISVANRLLTELGDLAGTRKPLDASSELLRDWYARRLLEVEPAILENWQNLRQTRPFWV